MGSQVAKEINRDQLNDILRKPTRRLHRRNAIREHAVPVACGAIAFLLVATATKFDCNFNLGNVDKTDKGPDAKQKAPSDLPPTFATNEDIADRLRELHPEAGIFSIDSDD